MSLMPIYTFKHFSKFVLDMYSVKGMGIAKENYIFLFEALSLSIDIKISYLELLDIGAEV